MSEFIDREKAKKPSQTSKRHISDLKIYDQPRELRAFTGLQSTRFGVRPVEVQRPPQSWCYVEDGR